MILQTGEKRPVETTIRNATPDDLDTVRALFKEYEEFLGFDLCFQDFQKELQNLPGDYSPPNGCLLVAEDSGAVIGCIALRPLNPKECEMKRLYVRPAGRGKGLGQKLCNEVIRRARQTGYERMKLDTVSKLKTAIELYRRLGFEPCEPYCENPQPDVEYYQLPL